MKNSLSAKRINRRGVTLIELMIAVAIIGVVLSIGVPAYKRQIQKAYKAEAKTGLAALFVAEQAFFSDYHGYGNNLYQMGFSPDMGRVINGRMPNAIYSIGFPSDAGCNSTQFLRPVNSAVNGAINDPLGTALANVFTDYYKVGNGSDGKSLNAPTASPNYPYQNGSGVAHNGINNNCASTNIGAAYTTSDGATITAGQAADVFDSGTNGHDNAFFATATGVISSAFQKDDAKALTDVWSIDHTRTLSNLQDGVK